MSPPKPERNQMKSYTGSEALMNFRLGLGSLIRLGLAPLGSKAARFHRQLNTEHRRQEGLVIILPGIDGCSSVSDAIARGLCAGRVSLAIQILDWRSSKPWNPFHLTRLQHNRESARWIADSIATYRKTFPAAPVHLVGYSAGAGMALFVIQELIARSLESQTGPSPILETVVLLSAAVSRAFDISPLLPCVRGAIWNFYSPVDLPTVGLGTTIFGTMDRKHTISSGALGFFQGNRFDGSSDMQVEDSRGRASANRLHSGIMESVDDEQAFVTGLRQVCYSPRMLRSWNLGGHFGFTNAAFVRRYLARIINAGATPDQRVDS